MAKNDEGEFELVVGNKQLLSIFFIIMVLFGVVFSMGYFVGRNSSEPAAQVAQNAEPARQARSEVPAFGDRAAPAPAAGQPAAQDNAALEPGEAKVSDQPSTTPVGGVPAAPPAPAAAPPAAPAPAPAAESKPVPPPKPAEVAKQSAPASAFEPKPGQVFLQVAAVKRPEAELIVDVLRKRGLPALVAPVASDQPTEALWRALVGPLKDAASISKARTDLEAAGFKQAIVRKY